METISGSHTWTSGSKRRPDGDGGWSLWSSGVRGQKVGVLRLLY